MSTPYENAAARVPPPEKASPIRTSSSFPVSVLSSLVTAKSGAASGTLMGSLRIVAHPPSTAEHNIALSQCAHRSDRQAHPNFPLRPLVVPASASKTGRSADSQFVESDLRDEAELNTPASGPQTYSKDDDIEASATQNRGTCIEFRLIPRCSAKAGRDVCWANAGRNGNFNRFLCDVDPSLGSLELGVQDRCSPT
jgi:hypothetical protein